MAEKTILFTAPADYSTVPPVHYSKGDVETFREDIATRWIARGLATDDPAAIAQAKAAKEPPPAPPEPAPPTTEGNGASPPDPAPPSPQRSRRGL